MGHKIPPLQMNSDFMCKAYVALYLDRKVQDESFDYR